jgi:hypothetical protein
VVVATEARSRTAQNAEKSSPARLALGTSRDVVMIGASAAVVDTLNTCPSLKRAYRERTGRDPDEEAGAFVYVCLRPQAIQVSSDVDEIIGRTVLRDGIRLS